MTTTLPLPRNFVLFGALGLVCAMCVGPARAESTASGTFASTNMHATFKDVYAYRTTDEFFDETREVTEVVISEKPLDKAALAAALQGRGEDSTTSVLWDKVAGAFAKLTIDADGGVALYLYVPPGYNLNMSGFDGAEIKVNTPQRIEGGIDINDTDSDGPRKLQLAFAADVGDMVATSDTSAAATTVAEPAAASVEPAGEQLPTGGGEPGDAFQQAMQAQRAGDVDAMLKLSSREKREEMLAAREKPEFAAMVEMMKQMSPAEVSVTGGRINGDTATLDFQGKYADGGQSTGTAELVKEDGAWVMKQVNERIGSD